MWTAVTKKLSWAQLFVTGKVCGNWESLRFLLQCWIWSEPRGESNLLFISCSHTTAMDSPKPGKKENASPVFKTSCGKL